MTIRETKQRLIIGISGASGIQYGIRLLELIRPLSIETHLIVTKAAQQVRQYETSLSADELSKLADHYHHIQDVGCSIASGSFTTLGMIIAPCSMHTLAEIAHGLGSNALTRAADVILKERRKLVLMVRESPLNAAHLENMLKITQMGGIIAPPVPAFYNHPQSLDDLVNHSVGRVLDLFDIDVKIVRRWQ
ncbi:UbiX family flavin prenyltransferase [Legionella impletisoli]|uniref:Flavin prenyltransferase UbiX n=1 Tax=Legionella impletisoli TaxID=343510 RepID=A0A917JNE7_9GAMM|nr:UbiX family flavin prenyltransferase [Legionella impletisoli]GGI75233.1 flavin prenyltransferase UbiX [Legionella impletisoli]